MGKSNNYCTLYVAVNFLLQEIFLFPLLLGMVKLIYTYEVETKKKLPEVKN